MTHPDFARLDASWIPSHADASSLAFLDGVIGVVRRTEKDSWWAGPTFRSPCGTRHCALSHVYEEMGEPAFDRFESEWPTSYVIGAQVNDRPSESYPQEHPRDRILAYLDDLREGRALDTQSYLELRYFEGPGESDSQVAPAI